jgi:hypothetical protein
MPAALRSIAGFRREIRPAAIRLLRQNVDRAAQRALAVKHGSGPAEHFDRLDVPRVGRKGQRARGGEEPDAVDQLKHRALAAETACRERRVAIAWIGDIDDARRARSGVDH